MELLENRIELAGKLDNLRNEYKKLNEINLDKLKTLIN